MIEIPSFAQRYEAVKQAILEDPTQSDRSISARLGCSRDLVYRVRLNLSAKMVARPARVRGRDGKTYPTQRAHREASVVQKLKTRCDRLLRELESEMASESWRDAPESVRRRFAASLFHLNVKASKLRRMARKAV